MSQDALHDRPPDDTALAQSQARFAGIIDSAMDAIITVDSRQNILLFNKAAQKMFRCAPQDAIGKPLGIFIPQRYRQAHVHHVEKFGQSHVSDRSMGARQPLMALRADGEEFPIEASISQVNEAGQTYFTAIVRDISQRVRADKLLREMEARYRTIYQHAGVGILMINRQGLIIDANPACEKLLSFSSQELQNRPYNAILLPKDAHALHADTLFKQPKNRPATEIQTRFVTRDAKRVWVRVVHTLVRDSDASPLYIIAIVEDISRKKRAQQHLKRLRLRHQDTLNRLARLTNRERQVMWLMIDGNATKVIASDLGTSPKTIDVHRARVMEKMQADSLAQLVQMVMPIRKYISHHDFAPSDTLGQ